MMEEKATPAPAPSASSAASESGGTSAERAQRSDRGGRPSGRPRDFRRGGRRGGGRRFFHRRKVCKFCVEKLDHVDYKDVKVIGQFTGERGKILPRRLTGVCTQHQRQLKLAIKRARNIALLPFAARR